MDFEAYVTNKFDVMDTRMRNIEVCIAKMGVKTGVLWATCGGLLTSVVGIFFFFLRSKF